MKQKANRYTIGDKPYDTARSDWHTKGNGEWFTTAMNVEDALNVIFNSLPFPGEATGRKLFLPGISLEGVHSDEVIQVWSTQPEIVAQTKKILKQIDSKEGGFHDGHGKDFGLELELPVTDIDRYLKQAHTLLAAPASDSTDLQSDTPPVLSPMGASLVQFHEKKEELQLSIQRERMELTKAEWAMENLSDEMEEKVKLLNQQMMVLNTYLHGTRHRVQLARGNRGSGRYKVFQNRQFLSDEIAVLGNFDSDQFDFKSVPDLEKWLCQSGRIFKFLPFERCILVTRIRKDRKEYGDPISNVWNNMENMQNIVWIRDGDNVFHVDVEQNFTNAIFPGKDQFNKALNIVQNHIFTKSFELEETPTDWRGDKLKPGEYDVMGEMCRKPLEEEKPYCTRAIVQNRFKTMQDWLDNKEAYPDVLNSQIVDAVHDYLRKVNKRQMIFAVLLQGIVDNTSLLDIPKGTDLFNWETVDQYFELLYDYTHAITWNGISDKIKPYINGPVKKGEWIITEINEYVETPKEKEEGIGMSHRGSHYKETWPMLLQVTGVLEGKPVVKYHPKLQRWRRDVASYEDFQKARKKEPVTLTVAKSSYLRVPMPPSLAEQILDDRNWKMEHKWLVPWMVNYKQILTAVKKGVNGTIIKYKANYADD